MTYPEALDYIYSQLPMFHRIGAAAYKPDLGNIGRLCDLLGNPQKRIRTIHVAGTNGKGSVSHMLASIFMECGFRTGLFTSPHLKDFRERIRVNGRMIPKKRVAAFISEHHEVFEEIHPSFFEMSAALAFAFFEEEKAEVAVIETGMGGRLDSTNVITPEISVITNISMDHAQFLGDTLEKIAGEKAGIIKPGIPVVIGESDPATNHVFVQKASEVNAPIFFADRFFHCERVRFSGSRRPLLTADFTGSDQTEPLTLSTTLSGRYQLKNIVTTLGACSVMNSSGISIGEVPIKNGIRHVIRNTGLRGRWQVIGREPLTICDTGHNEAGLREVAEQIKRTPHQHLHMVFGAVADKDLGSILALLPRKATYYFCRADVPRALDAAELCSRASAIGLTGQSYHSVREAFMAAKSQARRDDLVFVGGSTFVVAEVL